MSLDDAYFTRAAGNGAAPPRRAKKPRAQERTRESLSREDRIRVARAALIKGGIGAVRIVPLAKALKVTRGGFYWHFRGRGDLLAALLEDWEKTNTEPFEGLREASGRNGLAAIKALNELWVNERNYSPAWDTAIRNWAKLSRSVEVVVKRVDLHRIELIREMFLDLGYRDPEALIRARITYFHQVGYYALSFDETLSQRHTLLPMYISCLVGTPPR